MKNLTRIFVPVLLSLNGFAQTHSTASISTDDNLQLTQTPVESPGELISDIEEEKLFVDIPVAPSNFFDLSDWSLSVPRDNDKNGKADHIKEKMLDGGYADEYFYASKDGGMVFKCPIGGVKTSKNTTYTRTELREMLRSGNTSIRTKGTTKNNWVLKSSRSSKDAGGYNGQLNATLAVNHVTITGSSSQIGRVVIGQIHASHNEPLRLYYRKLPNNKKGSIYFAHENANGKEAYYELIGSKSNSAENPANGIELDEKFSYVVSLEGNDLSVKIYRPFKPVVQKTISIKKSGYKNRDEYMYFKAGAYNQNKTGEASDYVQATFYQLSNSHEGVAIPVMKTEYKYK